MSRCMRRLLIGILAGLALVCSFTIESIPSVQAVSLHKHLHYYGADLEDVERATGVELDGTVDPDGPWPQFTQPYCFAAGVQALVNYADIRRG